MDGTGVVRYRPVVRRLTTRAFALVAAALVTLTCTAAVASAATQTWNLAHDFPADGSAAPANPWPDSYGDSGTWAAGYGGGGSYTTNAGGTVTGYSGLKSFSLAPASDWTGAEIGYAGVEAWNDRAGYLAGVHLPYVGKNTTSTSTSLWKAGSAFAYPAPDGAQSTPRGAIRWVSPIQGSLAISASFTSTHAGCGDGIDYSIDRQGVYAAAPAHVASGIVADGHTGFYSNTTLSVSVGDTLYFSVGDGRHDSSVCDSTSISLTITGSPSPNALWSPLFGIPGLGVQPTAVASSGTTVYAGGTFSTAAGGVAGYHGIAQWTGGAWLPLGPGLNSKVTSIVVAGSTVYAGGWFTATSDNSVSLSYLAKWNGTSWSPVGGGTSGYVYSLAYHNGILYVGGSFKSVDNGTVTAHNVAAYNVTSGTWSTMAGGVVDCSTCTSGGVDAMAWNPVSNELFVTGWFTNAGTTTAASFASWDGSTWHPYGSGLTGADGYALAVDPRSGAVYVGGQFSQAGGQPAANLAELSGNTWSSPGAVTFSGGSASVRGLALVGSTLYVRGAFDTIGGVAAASFAKLSGGTWSQVGAGLNPDNDPAGGSPLATFGSSSVVVETGAYAGSKAPYTGDAYLGYIGIWNGSAWQATGQGIVASASANPTDAYISALLPSVYGVYAGGLFAQAGNLAVANSIARWTGNAWTPLGSGLTLSGGLGVVKAMAMIGSDLYVAGNFDTAGGVPANNIAMWDGSSWHAVGPATVTGAGVTGGEVFALAVIGGNLYVGGNFTAADGAAIVNLAKYSPAGNTWKSLGAKFNNPGAGSTNGDVRALANYGNRDLMVGGDFFQVNGQDVHSFAYYDATGTTGWHFPPGIGGGTSSIHALMVMPDGELYLGGSFDHAGVTDTGAGVPANNVADWKLSSRGLPWVALGSGTSQGTDGTVNALAETTKALSGATVSPTIYMTGTFANAGGVAAPGAASYGPSTGAFAPLGAGLSYDPLDNVNGGFALAQNPNAGLFIGGGFRTAGGRPSGGFGLWGATAGLEG